MLEGPYVFEAIAPIMGRLDDVFALTALEDLGLCLEPAAQMLRWALRQRQGERPAISLGQQATSSEKCADQNVLAFSIRPKGSGDHVLDPVHSQHPACWVPEHPAPSLGWVLEHSAPTSTQPWLGAGAPSTQPSAGSEHQYS